MSMDDARKTILVLAYSISPIRGSEYANGWDYVTQMAKDHDLVVLFGLGGAHMGDLEAMEGATVPNVTFVPVMPGPVARLLNAPNRAGRWVYSFYLAYRLWHYRAYQVARAICRERRIDVVHYLCPIGFREPGYLWKLDKPYIWGPISALVPYPWRLFGHAGRKAAFKAWLRNVPNWFQVRMNPRLRRIMRRTDVLLACTSDNARIIREISGVEPLLFSEFGIVTQFDRSLASSQGRPLRLVIAGTVEARKAQLVALRALAAMRSRDWHLDVIGGGPLLDQAKTLAHELGIAKNVIWHGQVPRQRVLELFAEADVHVLPSLAEANTMVRFETLAHGLPTVAFDHCGMHDTICEKCGIRLPLDTVEGMVASLAGALARLVDDRTLVERLAHGARICAAEHSWDRRREFWNEIYELAEQRYAARKRT